MSWAHEKPTIFSNEDELQLKLEFARMCAEDPAHSHLHGYTLFPGEANYGRAMAAQRWLDDPVVQREINRLRRDDIDEILSLRELLAKKIEDVADSATDPKVKIEGYYKAADVLGYIKRGTEVNVNTAVVQNVIEVPTRATDDELPMLEGQWAEQQRRLVADARSNRPN